MIVNLKPKGKKVFNYCVQVVLLHWLAYIYPGKDKNLVDLKYGDRDITESSSAFSDSKGKKTGGGPLLS